MGSAPGNLPTQPVNDEIARRLFIQSLEGRLYTCRQCETQLARADEVVSKASSDATCIRVWGCPLAACVPNYASVLQAAEQLCSDHTEK